MVTTQQQRVITLAQLLARGKPIKADVIREELGPCSSATLTRTLNTLRNTYESVIVYHRSNHTYEMTERGTLTDKVLRSLQYRLELSQQPSTHGVISLRRDQRVRVSLSLPRSLVRALNQAAKSEQKNRSQWVEHIIHAALDPLSATSNPPPVAPTASLSKIPTSESI